MQEQNTYHSNSSLLCASSPDNFDQTANHLSLRPVFRLFGSPYNRQVSELRELHLKIVTYPHPTLRHKSKPIKRVDRELQAIVRQMLDLMYEANGVGLAANQVDLPIRLFVVNLEADPANGEEMVFINPVISNPKNPEEGEEGCLSLPGLYGNVTRPKKVRVNAFNLQGEEVRADIDGLFARVVQHETDHLDGVLFVDRMSETAKIEVESELDLFVTEFQSRRDAGGVPDDKAIAERLKEWETKYC